MQQQVGGLTSAEEYANYLKYGEQNRRRNRRLAGAQKDDSFITTYPPVGDPNWRWGIDIAGIYDGKIDAVKFRQAGGRWVIVKAADGTITSKYVYENVSAVQAQGLGSGHYNWLYPNRCVRCVNQGKAWAILAKALQPTVVAVDYEWTWYGGVQANPNADDLWIALDTCQQLLGKPLWIYSAYGYVIAHPLDSRFDANPKWGAQYGVLWPTPTAHFNDFIMHQESDRWGPASDWGINPNDAHVSDGNKMTPDRCYQVFGDVTDPVPTWQSLGNSVEYLDGENYHAIRFDPSQVTRVLDWLPTLPLVTVADWNPVPDLIAAINGGGFLEDDPVGYPYGICASQGKVRVPPSGASEQSIYWNANGIHSLTRPASIYDAINFPEVWLWDEIINTEAINSTNLDKRTLVGWKDGKEYWIVTEPMTDAQALAIAQALDLPDACCMDGGSSSGMKVQGRMVIGADGRAVPTHMGIRPRGGTNVATRAVCRVATNIKVMSGTNPSPLPQLFVGETVYGERAVNLSGVTTDIVKFDHKYDVNGKKVMLTALSKVSYSGVNLVLTDNVPEPSEPPPPQPVDDAMYGNFTFEQTDKSGNVLAVYKATNVVMPKQ